MNVHWSDKYTGMPYVEDEFDCGHLAVLANKQEFNRDIKLPVERRKGLLGLHRQIENLIADYGDPTDNPIDGDGVLMIARGRLYHVGIYCNINGVPWVLHNLKSAGQVYVHRVRLLQSIGLTLEGYYKWL